PQSRAGRGTADDWDVGGDAVLPDHHSGGFRSQSGRGFPHASIRFSVFIRGWPARVKRYHHDGRRIYRRIGQCAEIVEIRLGEIGYPAVKTEPLSYDRTPESQLGSIPIRNGIDRFSGVSLLVCGNLSSYQCFLKYFLTEQGATTAV